MPHTNLTPSFQDITPAFQGLPNMNGWYFTSVVDGISEEALPWMLAQGWQLNAASTDSNYDPPVTTYLMARTRMLHWNVLQSLLIDFTNAFNEGRAANDKRYEDVVYNWQNVLDKHQSEMTEFQTDKVQGTSGYVTLMLTTVEELGTEFETFEIDWDAIDDEDRVTALAELKNKWTTSADSAEAEYDTMVSGLDLPAIIADAEAAMDNFTAAIATFEVDYAALGETLYADWLAHAAVTRALLVDLGASELSRKNEDFANSLATQKQLLTDRGFYSSAIITDVTNRNTRDRDDAIAALNDKLMREKLTNEHTLFDQLLRARLGGLDAGLKIVESSAREVALRLQHGQWAAEIRHRIASLSIQTRLALLGMREKYYKELMNSISWESDRRGQLYDRLVQVRLKQFELRARTCDKDFELLKYQLDERNNIAASLFGFVERRTDAYPDQNAMAQLTANLGETGAATWQSA